MKNLKYLIITLATITITIVVMSAQNNTQNDTQNSAQDGVQIMTKKEAREVARSARRKAAAIEDQILFRQAVQALKDQTFIIEVDQVIFPRGMIKYVSSITNFIYIHNGKAIVQISPSNFRPGPNGVGGVTLQGTPSGITMNTDKKGNVYYNFMDQGVAISASISIQLIANTNRVTVNIFPNFNSNNLTLMGNLLPFSKSNIFQGQTL